VGGRNLSWNKKRQAVLTACLKSKKGIGSDVGLGFAKSRDAITGFPLAPLAKSLDALEALEDVAFDDEAVGALETFVL